MKAAHEKLKSCLLKKFEEISEAVAKQGRKTLLNDVYTNFYMIESESKHEVLCTDIFSGQKKQIRTVVTKGIAGIGKTISVQKFILDWAKGKLNQDVYFIFVLPFRELNAIKTKQYSLLKLIYYFHPELEMYGNVLFGDKKVLFIFDGLDESRLSLLQVEKWADVTTPTSVELLLTNLINGNLLPTSALLWITTRPAAASMIRPEFVNRVTEVKGFKDPQKEEYFRKRFADNKSLSRRAITCMKSTRSLYIMCHIPVFCWALANVLEQMLGEADDKGQPGPKPITQIYTRFLDILTGMKNQKYLGEQESKPKPEAEAAKEREIILKMGELAFKNLEEDNIFYEEDLNNCSVDIGVEVSVYSGVCTEKDSDMNPGKVFRFIDLSMQQYFAALYVFLSYKNDKVNVFQKNQMRGDKFSNLFKKSSLFDLHKNVVDKALSSENGKHDLFLRFLLGISKEPKEHRRYLLKKTDVSSHGLEETIRYIKGKIKENMPPERTINLFHCLIELEDNSLVNEVLSYFKSGSPEGKNPLLPEHGSALAYHILMSEEMPDEFDLKKYIRSDKWLLRLLPVIKNSRGALKYKLKKLNVDHRGECRNKPGLRKYACKLTLDPNTAHKHLSLSEGNTKHGKQLTEISTPPSKRQRVGVYLDCPGGTLSFYDVAADATTLLHTFHTTFSQPVYPGFAIGFQLKAGEGHRLDSWEEPSTVSLCKME
ncbi:hypothetical protein AAFF_G00321020 [Aldrovandia affinis]|uniref:NACHT domain-containing protein n=1 Tax=Aldrovandia affinis TaxID=143900 RepID=A0AAD7R6W8_9TELE|nr:hypothetical protein AAFF_G00321020 [Aldrovandia affinis]